MISTIFHHKLSTLKIFETFKAGLLCVLMLLASAPSLHAETQCATPQETNCNVNLSDWGCGSMDQFPCYITYTLTLNDATPGAVINYQIFCDGNYYGSGQVYSGGQIVWQESYYNTEATCYNGSLTGNMTATAPGYSQSAEGYLSF